MAVQAVDVVLDIFKYALLAWLGLLCLLVVRRVFLNRNAMNGLLTTTGRHTEPERVLLLMFTIGFAMYYTLTTAMMPIDKLPEGENGLSMPDIAPEVLLALFGAQSSFVIGKLIRTLGLGGLLK